MQGASRVPRAGRGDAALLDIRALHVRLAGHAVVQALNLPIRVGETRPLVGESGCGKPSLSHDPRQRVGDIRHHALSTRGVRQSTEWKCRIATVRDDAGLGASALDRDPRAFSRGWRRRVGIARSLVLRRARRAAAPVSPSPTERHVH